MRRIVMLCIMLVFVDESGDPGLKFSQGSSKIFLIATVVMPTHAIAEECSAAIKEYRKTRGLQSYKEFHFSKDHEELREGFCRAVAGIDFWYSSAALDKERLVDRDFSSKKSVYKHTVNLAFQHILGDLHNATVVFDACGGREFGFELRNYVMKKANEHSPNKSRLKKIKSQKSHTNDLLQLADMICGAIARSYSTKTNARIYRNILSQQERSVNTYPG